MWLLLKRLLVMSAASWALAKAAQRWPRLAIAQRLLGTRRYGPRYRGR